MSCGLFRIEYRVPSSEYVHGAVMERRFGSPGLAGPGAEPARAHASVLPTAADVAQLVSHANASGCKNLS